MATTFEDYKAEVDRQFGQRYPGRVNFVPDFALRGFFNAGRPVEEGVNDALWWSDRTEEGFDEKEEG